MSVAVNALIPIICLIFVGTLLKRINFFDPAIWPALEKLSYYVLTPILLVYVLASKSIDHMPWQEIALAVDIPILLAAVFFWLSKNFFKNLSAQSFTSIFQGGVRFNTFVGLSVAQGLFGAEGVVIGALCSGFMIVLINLLCVTTFSLTIKAQGNILKTVFLQIIKNPLIMGCVLGWSINVSGLSLPAAIFASMEVLGRASLPIALITVGAALQFSNLFKDRGLSIFAGFVQFAFKPVIAAVCCYLFGLNGITAATLILFLSTPTAPSSYILARQLGGDHEMMASLITQQTLFAFLSIPVTIWVLGQFIPLQ
ncbi:AEC family transporter [Terasakiella sp. A23]|uniref:AEC family transporter n=1 Tax=Terasakiella sp. FCG-A23 TaxID=3080561 RepID=UPI0029559673|nr:AEC family transporter [Terasakiella sp. A23]MDV7339782.1 AEC family transporter [Terasakiella sp. A23]